MPTVFLIYPPGPLFQRGEERCQSNIAQATATAMRAPNDLGYAAAILKQAGYQVFLRDYATEQVGIEALLGDIQARSPDLIFLSTTQSTLEQDLDILDRIRGVRPSVVRVLSGALFYKAHAKLLTSLVGDRADYLIGGEAESVLLALLHTHFGGKGRLSELPRVHYRRQGCWHSGPFDQWVTDLDQLPFPDRGLFKQELYQRPDTGEPQATIITSRGCPYRCSYCLTPVISGRRVRYRSPESVLEELRECYHRYGIRNFFFRSDTFTVNPTWVVRLCDLIRASELHGHIAWAANSRAHPLSPELLNGMASAGCWLVAFGFESGSSETLSRIRKGATTEHNRKAARWAREAGLKVFGFFMIGFPWETLGHLEQTRHHLFELKPDFVELHLAQPYPNTVLYREAQRAGVLVEHPIGQDYFGRPTLGTRHLPMDELCAFRRSTLRRYHLRAGYLRDRLGEMLGRPRKTLGYLRYGLRLLRL